MEEWALLDCEQKAPHQEVMVEDAKNMASFGDGLKIVDAAQEMATPFLTAEKEVAERMREKERPEEKELKEELGKYSSSQYVDISIFLHNDDAQAKAACPGCGKILRDELGLCDCYTSHPLKFHKNIPKAEDPYQGLEFGENPSQKSHQNSHQGVHEERKQHQCITCGKSFRNSAALISHQRIHREERWYQCREGRTMFTQSKEPNSRKKSPTGNNSSKCLECGKSFSWRENLYMHQRIH
uniref:C2H2-type domain-containing protein n=1 Tax=Micrurus lemniscatus lemniscatus TaxID=129467 RepID=A0A2D4I0B0_MICLE